MRAEKQLWEWDRRHCIPSHPTPASAVCWQLCVRIGLLEHSSNWLALEVHWTSSRKMGPVPAPKWALLYAMPAVMWMRWNKLLQFLVVNTVLLTSSVCISQLFADHSGISSVPEVITHCPPLVIDAHLHSTLILIGTSHKTNISVGAGASNGSDYGEEI